MLHHQEKYLPKITFSPSNYQLRDHSCYQFIILNKTFNFRTFYPRIQKKFTHGEFYNITNYM